MFKVKELGEIEGFARRSEWRNFAMRVKNIGLYWPIDFINSEQINAFGRSIDSIPYIPCSKYTIQYNTISTTHNVRSSHSHTDAVPLPTRKQVSRPMQFIAIDSELKFRKWMATQGSWKPAWQVIHWTSNTFMNSCDLIPRPPSHIRLPAFLQWQLDGYNGLGSVNCWLFSFHGGRARCDSILLRVWSVSVDNRVAPRSDLVADADT